MSTVLTITASIVIGLHGLVHVMGFYVYARLGEIEGLPYKTNVLKGKLEFKKIGMIVFGIIWLITAVGFVIGGVALGTGHEWAATLILWTSIISLIITSLDYSVAYMGIIVNIGILIASFFL